MLYRIEVSPFSHIEDILGNKICKNIHTALGLPIDAVKVTKVFTLAGFEENHINHIINNCVLHDPIIQQASTTPAPTTADWIIEISFKPGVTDNEGRTAKETAALVLQLKNQSTVSIYTSFQYHIYGTISKAQLHEIATNVLSNTLIHNFEIKSQSQWNVEPGFKAKTAKVTGKAHDAIETIPVLEMTDKELITYSTKNTLALNLEELQTIKAYFTQQDVQAYRESIGLKNPTDAEIEMLAQTWSEHCKHKIFSSLISYKDLDTNTTESIDSIYKTYIQNTTKAIRSNLKDHDFCRSVFKDNAGVIAFNETHDVCIKVETHNSPSALDPYGGALTGIVGVNRDPMGTGLGAELVCNLDVFCFASPFYKDPLPPRILHPRRIFEGVREGVEHGGNKSGIPTVNGSVVFDDCFLGKPLVFCGTVGIIPCTINGKKGYEKKAQVDDYIVMAGGRIGKDGIHGATFSSEELHEDSPATAVQIGDPITQRKLYDFIIQARNLGLYNAITDNGAGGLSSSVGEMAQDTGGCKLDLSNAPLKYDGLYPWEILLSEAQERMTFAVPKKHIQSFLQLAQYMNVEATVLGTFTNTGFFHATYNEKPLVYISMDFLHNGLPQLKLTAQWKTPTYADTTIDHIEHNHTDLLKNMLGRLNICSKEYLIRQYDHEVQGGSVIKPLMGIENDAPMDAAVIRPILYSENGLVISHGICPKFSKYDTYWMTANAIDEAIRNAVAVGADPSKLAGVDNFCWCDPIQSEKTPDGHYKLAQLVRACQALSTFCFQYNVPCISGKDSMKNDYLGGGTKISIHPTLLFSVLGFIDDVSKAITSDLKNPGDYIYIIGKTSRELAGSEIASELDVQCSQVPLVDAITASENYRRVHKAIQHGLITACHDLSDGGLAVALAEMALGGRIGCTINLDEVPITEQLSHIELLYSESASRLLVSINPKNSAQFEALLGQAAQKIGTVTNDTILSILNKNTPIITVPVEELATAFKATLNW